jgi:CheY-like chemotaxis protein
MNLAVNARDAMPGGGRLEISTSEVELDAELIPNTPEPARGRYVLVTVADNGSGMTEEVRRNIFEPFFTTKDKGKGTGLGLATVYGILRQNDGWIDLRSEIGQGSTFRIYLPRIDAALAADVAKPAADGSLRGEETVLIVEDQHDVRRLAKEMLHTRGYRVLEAANGDDAHAVVRQHTGAIDLLLTDVVMPGVDGRTLSEQLRQLRPDLKVILMSGYAEDVVTNRGVLTSGLRYIQKPFKPNELATVVRQVLDNPAVQ